MQWFRFAVAFVLMEPVTYAAHRWLMHGAGWVLHRSHHQVLASRFEANDLFPLFFSTAAMLLFAVATQWSPLWPVCWGITVYGAVYLFVHDAYIHARLKLPRRLLRFLQPLSDAHRIHHLYGGEPYGMLCPIVPSKLRRRAARTDRNPLSPLR
jgi:beta-carotene 3-hydroxylase